MIRNYIEDSLCMSTMNESTHKANFGKMQAALKGANVDPFRNAGTVLSTPEYLKLITEAVKIKDLPKDAHRVIVEDANRLNQLYENVASQLLDEATMNIADISPIAVNSFGIQERALISAHLPRAVKQVTAKVDNFKLTERIPYIVDLNGVKKKFIDAFTPDADGTYASITLRQIVPMEFAVPSSDVDLYAGSATSVDEEDPGYRPSVNTNEIFGLDSALDSITVGLADSSNNGWASSASDDATAAVVTFEVDSLRSPSPEDGTFRVHATWNEYNKTTYAAVPQSAIIMGQFDISSGKLVSLTSTNAKVTYAKFKMVISPEMHNNALTVSYEMKHVPVSIPVGDHFEYNLTEEFKDASDKYYNVDAMALLTDYVGKAVEQVKDITTLSKYQELAETAIIKTKFDCTPAASFSQGKEEYIRREFNPFIEKVCIILKSKVHMADCHFRVLGNPLDIRVAASAGTEYIYKRNEQFAGEIGLDYEFSVTSDIHKIFYLSSERVPVGKVFVFLIPNEIENNISTVNFYELCSYVSNRYHASKNNLPTVMVSTRYLCKEYYPVLATVEMVNNLTDSVSAVTGTGLADSVYAKVRYANA